MPDSTIFPIFLRAEYSDSTALQRFQSDAQRAAMAAKREFEGVGAALESALSRARNSGGSLDLGLDGLRQAAAQQQQVATAARELAEATRRAATANGQFDASMSRATRAAFQLANAEEATTRELQQQIAALEAVQRELDQTASATDLVTAAARRGTTANQSVINSQRASRTAFIQLGQQMQDVAVQAQLGTNAFIIFGQQVPQAAFALSGLADSTNRTQAAIGRFATFLSGPWGAAIFVAIAALGPFVQKLFESGDAANKSERAQRSLTEVLADTKSSYEEVTKALDDYNRAQQRSQEVSLQALAVQAAQIASNLKVAISVREKIKAELELFQAEARNGPTGPNGQGQIAATIVASGLSDELGRQNAEIGKLITAAGNTRVQVATEIARVQSDSSAQLKLGFDVLRSEARRTITDVNALSDRLTQINRAETAALEAERRSGRRPRADRSAEVAARRAAAEVERLANFGESAAEQVARISERFDEQPRLIDQAAQASRQLSRVIGDINTELTTSKNITAEQRMEFERIKTAATDAQDVIGDALLRPFQDLRRESAERLQIEALLAQGRDDEAAALQEILRIEQVLGREVDLRARVQQLIADGQEEEAARLSAFLDAYGELKDEAAARVIAERGVTRELQVQRELLELQADVARTVADDLRSILSGRPTEFFRNFRQALADLQGARLFESLFGDTFRQIEEELRGNSPQGRANARYTAEVERTATATEQVGDAALQLADALTEATQRIAGTNAANDNALGEGTNEIVVPGNRPTKVDVSTMSAKDIADRIAKGTVEGFLGPLEDLLGPRFTAQLGAVLSSTLSGFIRGGKPGAVLGGLEGLSGQIFGADSGITRGLGDLLGGAEVGTQIAGISKALGLGGSTTGAQIGGTIGSFIPIPGGQIIGAIAGSIIGSLIKGTPRGSATIGGVGGGLGITGTVGNRGSLKDTANNLAGSVLEAVDNIARQLGATVDGSRGSVSIGQRKNNLRVDPNGRGATKIGNGAIDFGDDAEAAIAFAVQNLIQDGVIVGLKASENRLLQAGKDISAALQDVLTFRSVFDRLKAIKDPVGAAIDEINREFTGLIDLFNRAGASAEEFAQLEELYGLERARAIEDATDSVVGSLRQLLNELKIGDSGLSLRSRRANAVGEFNALASRVAAGDTSAFDEFSDISQQLLDIERQLFGSTQSYFDRLAQITGLTEQAIAGQDNVSSIGSTRPSPFGDAPQIDRSIDTMNQNLGAKLDTLNYNLIAALGTIARPSPVGGGGSGGGFASEIFNNIGRVANF